MRYSDIRKRYFDLLNQEKLPYIHCKNCNKNFYYPRPLCPYCGSSELEVSESSGLGKVFSFTVIPSPEGDIIYAIIELDEGFRIYSNIIGKNRGIDIGDRVRVKFLNKGTLKVPFFEKIE
ncbi:MAG: OB-fold domain-containing protein [Sulfolobaceae archaeon]